MKDFKFYVIGASILLLVYVVFLYNKPNPVNWKPTLSNTDKIPFGTYIFYNRLKDIFEDAEISTTDKSPYSTYKKGLRQGNQIIITKTAKLSKADLAEMVKYIKKGNNVFIAAFNWQGELSKILKLRTASETDEKLNPTNFTNPQLKRKTPYSFDKELSENYFSRFDTTKATILAKNTAGSGNLLKFDFGKGSLILCANPLLFSNYALLQAQGIDHAEKAISYLPQADNVYWDLFQNHDVVTDVSPLRVFFANPALQWAYYLSLAGLLIFVLYEIKRRQRVIPISDPLQNSTVEFVSVVGRVYYEKRDNANIVYKKVLYWLSYLREEHHLKTSTLDDEFIELTAHKTGVQASLIAELVGHINYLNAQQKISDGDLILLDQLIEKFYSRV